MKKYLAKAMHSCSLKNKDEYINIICIAIQNFCQCYLYFDTFFFSFARSPNKGIGRLSSASSHSSLGASGCVAALITLYCLSFPNQTVPIPGFDAFDFEPKGVQAALGWAVYDLELLRKTDGIGHGAHLGGYLFGFLTWLVREGDSIVPQWRARLAKLLDQAFSFLEEILE